MVRPQENCGRMRENVKYTMFGSMRTVDIIKDSFFLETFGLRECTVVAGFYRLLILNGFFFSEIFFRTSDSLLSLPCCSFVLNDVSKLRKRPYSNHRPIFFVGFGKNHSKDFGGKK